MINIICEVKGRYCNTEDCVSINEIEFFNFNNNVIPYTITLEDYYENERGWSPRNYWLREIWNGYNLYDGNKTYGDGSTALFNFSCSKDSWCRFLIKLECNKINELSHIVINHGTRRNPDTVNFYLAESYDKEYDLTGNNDKMTLISQFINTTNSPSSVDNIIKVDLSKLLKYIIIKDNKKYSIKNQFYNDVNKIYNPLNDDTDLTNKYLECDIKNYLNKKNISEEIFRPIDKFDKFQFLIKKR